MPTINPLMDMSRWVSIGEAQDQLKIWRDKPITNINRETMVYHWEEELTYLLYLEDNIE